MGGIYARPVSAEMIELLSVRYRAGESDKRPAVGSYKDALFYD